MKAQERIEMQKAQAQAQASRFQARLYQLARQAENVERERDDVRLQLASLSGVVDACEIAAAAIAEQAQAEAAAATAKQEKPLAEADDGKNSA